MKQQCVKEQLLEAIETAKAVLNWDAAIKRELQHAELLIELSEDFSLEPEEDMRQVATLLMDASLRFENQRYFLAAKSTKSAATELSAVIDHYLALGATA